MSEKILREPPAGFTEKPYPVIEAARGLLNTPSQQKEPNVPDPARRAEAMSSTKIELVHKLEVLEEGLAGLKKRLGIVIGGSPEVADIFAAIHAEITRLEEGAPTDAKHTHFRPGAQTEYVDLRECKDPIIVGLHSKPYSKERLQEMLTGQRTLEERGMVVVTQEFTWEAQKDNIFVQKVGRTLMAKYGIKTRLELLELIRALTRHACSAPLGMRTNEVNEILRIGREWLGPRDRTPLEAAQGMCRLLNRSHEFPQVRPIHGLRQCLTLLRSEYERLTEGEFGCPITHIRRRKAEREEVKQANAAKQAACTEAHSSHTEVWLITAEDLRTKRTGPPRRADAVSTPWNPEDL